MRMLFVKEGAAIWSSHLDLMRALMRSFRRAGIDLKHSQGFTPHPELSILMPLSVGVESQCEIAEFALAEGCAIPPEEIAHRLNPVLPAGIRALESWEGGQKAGKLAWLRARLTLTYQATGNGQQATEDGGTDSSTPLRFAQNDTIEALTALFARPSIVVEKHGKKGPTEVDIAPMIREVTVGAAETSPACRTQQSGGLLGVSSPLSQPACDNWHPQAGRPALRPVEGCRPHEADAPGMQNATCKMQNETEGCSVLVIEALVAAQNPTLNPLLLATAVETWLPEYRPDLVQCRRLEIYDAEMKVFR